MKNKILKLAKEVGLDITIDDLNLGNRHLNFILDFINKLLKTNDKKINVIKKKIVYFNEVEKRSLSLKERRDLAIKMFKGGYTYQTIADKLDYGSRQAAYIDINKNK